MVDPIALEVIRCKLEAIADDGARTVIRTAVSPAVADGGDCSCAIYDVEGNLLVGGGPIVIHFHTGCNGVKTILSLHGSSLADGDVFMTNDPYSGGGFHAQDVYIHKPVFVDGKVVAWVGASAHMMDMGGSVLGSFSPSATECYQEALRFPPVRIVKAGEEQSDIWAIFKNNIRLADMVEIDVRSLISACHFTARNIVHLVEDYGALFVDAAAELINLSEAEMRRRIGQLEPGEYSFTSWSEWTKDYYKVPCTLTVTGTKLRFDFTEASPQSTHYFNSKPFVIKSLLGVQIASTMAHDLPLNEGIFRTFEVVCRPGSILDAQPPAPIGAPHLDVGMNASETAMHALNLAIAASPRSSARANMSGPSGGSGISLHTVVGTGLSGDPDGWLMMDGGMVGCSAGHDRDPADTFYEGMGRGAATETIDIEVLESWYPLRVERRGPRPGTGGAGAFRAGAGTSMAYWVEGADALSLTLMGNRERVPIAGLGGGLPGALTDYRIGREDGSEDALPCHQQGVPLKGGERIIFDLSSGGGWGDPLDRSPDLVRTDIRSGRISESEAREIYGVISDDDAATIRQREAILAARLDRADPALRPLQWTPELRTAAEGIAQPLYVGVEQSGSVAVSARSGAPLAKSPDHWTDGCPIIHGFLPSAGEVDVVAYLDPGSGHLMAVDVVVEGTTRSFETKPHRWIAAATARDGVSAARA